MKKLIKFVLISLAIMCVIASFTKAETPTPTPVYYEMISTAKVKVGVNTIEPEMSDELEKHIVSSSYVYDKNGKDITVYSKVKQEKVSVITADKNKAIIKDKVKVVSITIYPTHTITPTATRTPTTSKAVVK